MFFAKPELLYLFILLPLLALILQWGHIRRRRSERRYADLGLLKPLKPETSSGNRMFRNFLTLLAIAFIILALARPQMPHKSNEEQSEMGSESVFALDISNSMLAEDASPNRLEFAKLAMLRVVNNLGASQVAVVVFAGSAFTHLPLTGDISTAKSFIMDCSPSMLTNQGTAIGPAIERAMAGFSDRKEVGKAIFLFTDGEDHDSDALQAARRAKDKGIKLYTVAVGSDEGALIPFQGGYLQDQQGETVLSKANLPFCQELAEAGGGETLIAKNVASLSRQIMDKMKELPKASMDGRVATHEELYGYFLAVASILLLLSFFIPMRKNRLFSQLKLFDR